MPAKSELFSVRTSEELDERIAEIVEKRKENAAAEEYEPGEPDVHRQILREGVEVLEGEESDLRKLRHEKEQLEQKVKNPTGSDWLDVSLRAPRTLQGILTGVGLTVFFLFGLMFFAAIDTFAPVGVPQNIQIILIYGVMVGLLTTMLLPPILFLLSTATPLLD
jgi:hypothetical protein